MRILQFKVTGQNLSKDGDFSGIVAGTRVVKAGKAGTSRQIFSNSEINSLLGVTDSSNSNTAVFVSNGDGAKNYG